MENKVHEEDAYITGNFKEIEKDNGIEEEMINIEFESITESFMKKYERYSDRLKEATKQIYNEEGRKVHSLEANVYSNKNKTFSLSPFASAKTKSFEDKKEILKDELDLTFNQSNSHYLNNEKKSEGKEYMINTHSKDYFLTSDLENVRTSTNLPPSTSMRGSNTSSNSESRFTLPRRKKVKKIFEEFLVIGIENDGLEYINDLDEMHLTPKIIYNYPNQLGENELKL